MSVINTLALLKSELAAGGTHTIVAGTYVLDASITLGADLVLTATGPVTIDGDNLRRLIQNGTDITFSGFDADNHLIITQGSGECINMSGVNGGFTGVFNFVTFSESASIAGVYLSAGTYTGDVDITFNDCKILNNAVDGISVVEGAVGAAITITCNRTHFEGQTGSGFSGDGITAHNDNHTLNINDCTFTNNTKAIATINGVTITVDGMVVDQPIDEVIWIRVDAGTSIVTINNLTVTNMGSGCSAILGQADARITVTNSKFIGNGTEANLCAMVNGSGGAFLKMTNCLFYGFTAANKTTVDVQTPGTLLEILNCTFYDNEIHIRTKSNTNHWVKNSLIINGHDIDFGSYMNSVSNEYSSGSSINNIFYNNTKRFWQPDSLDATDISEDPLFTDPAGGDFSLQSISPAIGFANIAVAPSTDILGVTRDALPDAGAYEFVAISSAVSRYGLNANDIFGNNRNNRFGNNDKNRFGLSKKNRFGNI